MPSLLNKLIHQETAKLFGEASNAIFVAYDGFDQPMAKDLRSVAKQAGGRAFLLKNSIAMRVLSENGIKNPEKLFSGATLAIVGSDAVAIAKAASTFYKKHEKGALCGGIVEGDVLNAAQVEVLSKLPSREALLGQLASVLAAPLRGIACVLNANLQGLVSALDAVRSKKEQETT